MGVRREGGTDIQVREGKARHLEFGARWHDITTELLKLFSSFGAAL